MWVSLRCNFHSLIRQVAEVVMARLATIPCPLGDKAEREVWKVEERRMQIKCDVGDTTYGWRPDIKLYIVLYVYSFCYIDETSPLLLQRQQNKCKCSRF